MAPMVSHSPIHTPLGAAAMDGAALSIGSNVGFSVWSKDTTTKDGAGFEPPNQPSLSHCQGAKTGAVN